ncbi:uncharacterized protein LOC131857738 [Cryptomeria japonica]|uniref:uncharacterized protein LOC131857738 n=1 Tax=Cryptomeria japonica TaxID=3369 RepID=UPI0027DA2744|nr:uncharacterized protein LOC131857738 [Cryptomeria japonica]
MDLHTQQASSNSGDGASRPSASTSPTRDLGAKGFSPVGDSSCPSVAGARPVGHGVTRKSRLRQSFGGSIPVTNAIFVNLKDDAAQEIVYNASILSLHGVILRCFKTRHATEHCGFEKKATKATWWKGASEQHYMVSNKSNQPGSFSEVVAMEPRDLGASPPDASLGGATEIVQVSHADSPYVRVNGPQKAFSGDSDLAIISGGSSDKAMPTRRNTDDYSETVVVGFHSPDYGEMVWLGKAMHVEEGWIFVKGKKANSCKPSFDMILRFHKSRSKVVVLVPSFSCGQLPTVSYLFAPSMSSCWYRTIPTLVGTIPVPTGTIPLLDDIVPIPASTIPVPVGNVPILVDVVPVPTGTVPMSVVPEPESVVPIPYFVVMSFLGTTSPATVWSTVLVPFVPYATSTTKLICGNDTRRCASGSPSFIFQNSTPTGCTSPTRLATVSASCSTKCAEDNFGGVNFTLILFYCSRNPPC